MARFPVRPKHIRSNAPSPRQVIYVQQAKEDKPERRYKVDVTFTLHCFTRGLKPGQRPDNALLYSDPHETRVFDFRRYSLSLQLPGIIDTLLEQKCFHTGQSNFFTVKLIDENGTPVEYEVFFKAYKPEKKRPLTLIVESAYVRDEGHSKRPAELMQHIARGCCSRIQDDEQKEKGSRGSLFLIVRYN